MDGHSVRCLFNTAEVRAIDLKPIIDKYSILKDGLISQLSDVNYFRSVELDSYGTLIWNNGVDFDPDNLYHMSVLESKSNDSVAVEF